MFYFFIFLSGMICSKSDRTNLAVYKKNKTKTTLKVTVSYPFIHTDPPQVFFCGCSLPFIFSQLLASTTWLN